MKYSVTLSKMGIINIAKYLEEKKDLEYDDIVALVSEDIYMNPKETFEVSISKIMI